MAAAQDLNGRLLYSAPGRVKSAAVLAHVNAMFWHEDQHVNVLRKSLALNIVRKAAAVDGGIAPPTDVEQYCVTASQAEGVVNRAWIGRYPSKPNPYTNLSTLLQGGCFLRLLPPNSPSAADHSSSSSSSSSRDEARVHLDMQLLLGHMIGSRPSGKRDRCPATPSTPPPPPPPPPHVAESPVREAGTAESPAGQAATPHQQQQLVGLMDDRIAGTTAAGVVAGKQPSTPNSCNSPAGPSGDAVPDSVAAPQQADLLSIPKRLLLDYIQKRTWDHHVDYNLMKRAVATLLVNKAADGRQACPLCPVSIHVAQAGEVFHKVWTVRHGTARASFQKPSDVLGSDPFLSLQYGPDHAQQLVQLDIAAMAAAAEAAAPASPLPPAVCETSAVSSYAVDGLTAADPVLDVHEPINSYSSLGSSYQPTKAVAAESVSDRARTGRLLAVDLLAFAHISTWHEANAALDMLRQQLAISIIQGAHPGLREAVQSGQELVACDDEARYAMSPYAAVTGLVAIWQAHCPNQPKPYTSLPNALSGCRHLMLKLSAGGNQVQLNLQQFKRDCATAMQQMSEGWQSIVDDCVAAVLTSSSSSVVNQATAPDAGIAEELYASSSGSSDVVQRLQQSSQLDNVISGTSNHASAVQSLSADAASAVGLSRTSNDMASAVSGAGDEACQQNSPTDSRQQQIPDMLQLLQLLSYAPPGICQHARVVYVTEAAQRLMSMQHQVMEPQRQVTVSMGPTKSLRKGASETTYDLYGIHRLQDLAGVSQMLDHLLACPVLAVGCCKMHVHTTASSSPALQAAGDALAQQQQQQMQPQLLLQILAPRMAAAEGAGVLDAAVYVFRVPRQQVQDREAEGSLHLLLNLLLGDPRVVKVVDGQQTLPLLRYHLHINVAGVMDINMLDEMLSPTEVIDSMDGPDTDGGGLESHVAAYKLASGQLESSRMILRSMTERGCSDSKPISAELVSTAASTVRPLMPLALSILQLLPIALMRRSSLRATGTLIASPAADPGPISPLGSQYSPDLSQEKHQRLQQLLSPVCRGLDLGVSPVGKQQQL